MADPDNIKAAAASSLLWNPADVTESLAKLMKYVEEEAAKSIEWYWRNKKWKTILSRNTQLLAIVLTSAAAIVPIVGELSGWDLLKKPLWASLLVGLAAALMGLDRAFGFSSGWARYVLAATNLHLALEEFRMDWAALTAKAGVSPEPAQVEELIQRAKAFRIAVEGLVLQETKDWVTEFQNNLARMEKDVTTQIASLKAQAEQADQARSAASQPGLIQLTVPNAGKAGNATIQVLLENAAGTVADEAVTGSTTWVRLNVAAGQYRVTVRAKVGGKDAAATAAVIVKPGESATPEISLPDSSLPD